MIWLRMPTVAVLAALVLLPVGLVVYQSFLDEPFFVPAARLTLSSYRFVLGDPDFARAFLTTLALAAGMTAIAVPLGVVPWNLYSLASLIVIAGLTHVPHVYLFSSTSLRKLNLELEEQARSMGAS